MSASGEGGSEMVIREQSVSGRTRVLGRLMVASGVVSVAVGALTIGYPPGVSAEVRGYPFPYALSLVVGVVLAGAHLLTGAGFWGVALARPHGRSRPATVGLGIAVVGFVVLTVAELLSSWRADESVDSAFSNVLDNVFGAGSVLTAIGAILAGVVIARRRTWSGLARWSCLASGLVMILLVIPALIAGGLVLSMAALMLWSLTFVPLGLAVARA
jgi:uncharacterized membrane protein